MQTDSLKDKTLTIGNTLLYAVKNGQVKRWFYEFQHGHPFLLSEEADIIVETRLNDKACKWMDDSEIQELVKIRVKAMYEKKFPNAKRWSLPIFNCTQRSHAWRRSGLGSTNFQFSTKANRKHEC